MTMDSQKNKVKNEAILKKIVTPDTNNNRTDSNTKKLNIDTSNSEIAKQYRSYVCSKSGGYMNLAIKQKEEKRPDKILL